MVRGVIVITCVCPSVHLFRLVCMITHKVLFFMKLDIPFTLVQKLLSFLVKYAQSQLYYSACNPMIGWVLTGGQGWMCTSGTWGPYRNGLISYCLVISLYLIIQIGLEQKKVNSNFAWFFWFFFFFFFLYWSTFWGTFHKQFFHHKFKFDGK